MQWPRQKTYRNRRKNSTNALPQLSSLVFISILKQNFLTQIKILKIQPHHTVLNMQQREKERAERRAVASERKKQREVERLSKIKVK